MRFCLPAHAKTAIAAGLIGVVLSSGSSSSSLLGTGMNGPATVSDRFRQAMDGLRATDGSESFGLICEWLSTLAQEGNDNPEAGEVLLGLLPENSPMYRERPRAQVQLIRGGVLAALAQVGPPKASLRWIRAELSTSNDPFVFGAACRAAGSLGPRAAGLVADLQRAFGRELMDHTFSLRDLHQSSPLVEPTTARLEAVNALRSIGPAAAKAIPVLREVAEGKIDAVDKGEELRGAARRAIQALSVQAGATDCCSDDATAPADQTLTPWKVADHRPDPGIGLVVLHDQDGREFRLNDLKGTPVFVSFFYTRCDNLKKCSRTVSAAATLRDRIATSDPSKRAHIVLVSLDPGYDDSSRLREYILARGFRTDRQACAAQTSPGDLDRLCSKLHLPVNFEGGRVNSHGVASVLLDGSGRLARTYHSVTWDEGQVLTDLERLASE